MCVYKQGEIWWYEFTVLGQRFRKSSRTGDMELAKLIEEEHRSRVEAGTGGLSPTQEAVIAEKRAARLPLPELASGSAPTPVSPSMTLKEAGLLWLASKSWKRRKPKTIECNRQYLWNLLQFFGDISLSEFHAGMVRDYQTERLKSVGPSSINHETVALGGILRQAGLWGKISDHYSALPLPEWQRPKVFTQEEQESIFEAAKGDTDFELADIVFTITRNTSACGSELRLSRIQNVHMETSPPTFEVTGDTTKNTVRPRVLPLNAEAEEAFRKALKRANRLGAHRPSHFLFPLRLNLVAKNSSDRDDERKENRWEWDPCRPASKSWLRKQTQRLRELTGIQHLRPHTWRHQICTELLEKGAKTQSVKSVMGWCSERMIEVYSHTRLEAKQDVIALLSNIGPRPEADGAEDILGNPAVQAEIDRQVAIKLQRQLSMKANGTRGAAASGLIVFPNRGRSHE
jgi:integrase